MASEDLIMVLYIIGQKHFSAATLWFNHIIFKQRIGCGIKHDITHSHSPTLLLNCTVCAAKLLQTRNSDLQYKPRVSRF